MLAIMRLREYNQIGKYFRTLRIILGTRDPHTVNGKITGSLLRLVTVFTFLSIAILTIILYTRFSIQLKSRADRLINFTALAIAQPLWDYDKNTYAAIIDAVALDPAITYIRVTDDNNTILMETGDVERFSHLTVRETVRRGDRAIGTVRIDFTPLPLLMDVATNTLLNFLAVGFIFSVLLVFIYNTLEGLVHTPLTRLMRSVENIGRGNLDQKVILQTDDEFEKLAGAFNGMLVRLREYQDRMIIESQLRREMEVARQIQTALLPDDLSNDYFEIAASMRPAETVGGDYFDVIQAAGSLWFIIGDVSGHGVTSGLISMMAQTAISTAITANPGIAPAQLLSLIDKILSENLRKMSEDRYMTITLFCSTDGNIVDFTGLHQDILLFRSSDSKVETIATDGIWIGLRDLSIDAGAAMIGQRLQVQLNDVLVLYSDGITEAMNVNEEMYGEDRLLTVLNRHGAGSARAIHDAIVGDVQAHLHTQHDDITLMVLKRK
ncbi:MAG: PP2C family protein-serine/threonine phosphatase [Leptospiraceae bacterium]|nr:PP2C family protein-serine/threonine phosphatase [Leptospiraceae bacterium]